MNIFIGLQKYSYKDFFKISKLELHLISLGSEFQNLVAESWKVLASSYSLLYFGRIKFKDPYLLCLSVERMSMFHLRILAYNRATPHSNVYKLMRTDWTESQKSLEKLAQPSFLPVFKVPNDL